MSIPITDLVTLAKMSPRATAGLQAAGIETAEQAAAMSDEQLLAIPYFKSESLGRLRQWQRGEGGALAAASARIVVPRSRPPVPRWAEEEPLARDLLVEMVKSSNNPGAQLADMAWQAAERFYDRLETRKEKLSHGERAGSAGLGGPGGSAESRAGDEGRPQGEVG